MTDTGSVAEAGSAPGDGGGWVGGVGAITLFVEDLDAAKAFYGGALALRKVYEDEASAVFDVANTIVDLLQVGQAPELIDPARVGLPGVGARQVITIDVADVDAVCADLTSRGVQLLNGPMNRPWGPRTASFVDPAGHIWEIASQPGGDTS